MTEDPGILNEPEGSNKKCNGTTGEFTWEVQLVPAQLTLKDIYNIIRLRMVKNINFF